MEIFIDKIIGQKHLAENEACEDIDYVRTSRDYLFAGLADGQSGKKHCVLGGKLSLSVVADYFEYNEIPDLFHGKSYDIMRYDIARGICTRLDKVAAGLDCPVTELASTMMGIAVDQEKGRFMVAHLGDGIVLGLNKNYNLETIIRPENGFTKYQTYLTTSVGMAAHLRLTFGRLQNYRSLYLLTDGAAGLIANCKADDYLQALLLAGDMVEFGKELRLRKPDDDASVLALKIC